MSRTTLAARMKAYEESFHDVAVRRLPVMIRVDGRAFHSLNLEKPFDEGFMEAMVGAAGEVASDMQGFKAAYVQSDEVSFCLTDYDTHATQGWFDYDVSKMVSISAALMTVALSARMVFARIRPPVFDSRVFSLPEDDVSNAFLWRAKDWERNSLQMYARSVFSHKQLHGKKKADMHEMLHQEGRNWATDLGDRERNGAFLVSGEAGIRVRTDVRANFQEISDAVGHLFVRPKGEAA